MLYAYHIKFIPFSNRRFFTNLVQVLHLIFLMTYRGLGIFVKEYFVFLHFCDDAKLELWPQSLPLEELVLTAEIK